MAAFMVMWFVLTAFFGYIVFEVTWAERNSHSRLTNFWLCHDDNLPEFCVAGSDLNWYQLNGMLLMCVFAVLFFISAFGWYAFDKKSTVW